VEDRELFEAIARAVDALPEDYREVIVLRDMEGLTAQDAAAAAGVSVDALKSRLHRARAALREALRPVFEAAAPPPRADCPDVMALWSRKLEGDLSAGDCADMERHLEGCPACGAACSALKS
jgi:RNA polymerase sigma-70 factor (ECF subfamily)